MDMGANTDSIFKRDDGDDILSYSLIALIAQLLSKLSIDAVLDLSSDEVVS
jgi:hypothetical protein